MLDLTTLPWLLRPTGDLSHIPPDLAARLTTGIPACIPSCTHEILLRANLIADPRLGMNELACQWVSRTDWLYSTEFTIDSNKPTVLTFDSLDTIAEIHLNDQLIGRSASEFIPWQGEITAHLTQGINQLSITLTSPLRHAESEAQRLGPRPVNGDWAPFNMIRKCACSFEWDWAPKLPTSGINSGASLTVVTRNPATGIAAFATRPLPEGDVGKGSQRVQQASAARIALDTTHGAFTFSRNGRPFFALGANWIPSSLFSSERTPEHTRPLLQAAKDAGMNMLRVWGGGRYEPTWFYDLCHELGLMVWQDFMFACACYPEEEPLRSLIAAEARHHVARLANHPAIALWCGGNENHWAHESWGFKEKLAPDQTWGRTYWQSTLPAIVNELAPHTPYWPDSPWSGSEAIHPNDPDHGDRHSWDLNFWDAWSGNYQKLTPRFCSEFGQQSPSNYATLLEAGLLAPLPEGGAGGGLPPIIPSQDQYGAHPQASPDPDGQRPSGPGSSWSSQLMGPSLAHRQRGPGGNQRWYDEPLDALFTRPTTFDQWHYAAQLLQARSLSTAIHWHRANSPRCSGSLLWQLNDVWPGLTWSIIDSKGRTKPAYHAVRAAMQPRTASFHIVDGQLTLFAVNDTDEPWEESPTLQLISFTGDIIRRWPCVISVPPRSSTRVGRLGAPDAIAHDPTRELIALRSSECSIEWFFLPDKQLNYPAPEFKKMMITPRPNGARIYLRARTLIRDLTFPADRIHPDAQTDAQPITLLPMERTAFNIEAPIVARKIFPMADRRWKFLRCANHLGQPLNAPLDGY